MVVGHRDDPRRLIHLSHINEVCQGSNGRVVEEGSYGDLYAEDISHPRDDPRSDKGVATEVEEVLLPPYRLQVERLAPDPGEEFLRRCAGLSRGSGTFLRLWL